MAKRRLRDAHLLQVVAKWNAGLCVEDIAQDLGFAVPAVLRHLTRVCRINRSDLLQQNIHRRAESRLSVTDA